MWLGGNVPAALERCGRLADGWIPAFCTPEDAAAGKRVIDEVAAAHGRRRGPGALRGQPGLRPRGHRPRHAGHVAVGAPGPRQPAGADRPGRPRRTARHDRALPRGGVLQVRRAPDGAALVVGRGTAPARRRASATCRPDRTGAPALYSAVHARTTPDPDGRARAPRRRGDRDGRGPGQVLRRGRAHRAGHVHERRARRCARRGEAGRPRPRRGRGGPAAPAGAPGELRRPRGVAARIARLPRLGHGRAGRRTTRRTPSGAPRWRSRRRAWPS